MIDFDHIYLEAGIVASFCVLKATDGTSLLIMVPGKLLGSSYFKFCCIFLPAKPVAFETKIVSVA